MCPNDQGFPSPDVLSQRGYTDRLFIAAQFNFM